MTLTRVVPASERWGEFLITAIFVQSLGHCELIRDEAAAAVDQIPLTLPAILDLDLDRQNRLLPRAVLTTLAYSFGSGMPRTVLAATVGTFTDHLFTNQELDDALAAVGFYLRRGVDEDGVSTYRPFHP